jgi:uroporphyrinogen decarboxylase
MNSRDKVLTALNHKEPDGIPVDLGSTTSSGISAIAYHNLREHLNIHGGHTRVYDVIQQLAQPEEMILNYFKIDIVDIGRSFNDDNNSWYDINLPNGVPVQFPSWFHPLQQPDGKWDVIGSDGSRIATMPHGATFFDQTIYPYQDGFPSRYGDLSRKMQLVHWSSLPRSPWDHATEADFWHQLRKRTTVLRHMTDRALVVTAGCNLFEWGTFLRRFDKFIMDLVSNPSGVERFLDALMKIHLSKLEKICRAVGDIVDVVKFGDDLGMNQGPLMSPNMYRHFFKPRHAILNAYVKNNSKMYTLLHSCGSIYKLIPDLIEAGFEIINPVQLSARDMDLKKLKNEFGNDIVFWGGGCDTRQVLNRGTPQEVRDHVRQNIEILAPGGGFVFNTVHNILPDVPPENIEAMFQTVDEYR